MHTFPTPAASPNPYQPTVLVVEDNLDDLFYLETALKVFDYQCLTAKTAISALGLAQKEQPDLILLDIYLPQINGIELLNILRIDWLTRNIPVVAITNSTEEKIDRDIANMGFAHCLYKPYLLEDLESVIGSQIGEE